jgi:5'-nucleotidase
VEEIVDNYPVVVNHSSHISLVVQAFAFGKYLGKLDLQFDDSGNINRYEGKPILLDQTIKEGIY